MLVHKNTRRIPMKKMSEVKSCEIEDTALNSFGRILTMHLRFDGQSAIS